METSSPSKDAVPTWEACKENVLPIKRGRSVKGLNERLDQAPKSSIGIAALQEKSFLVELSEAKPDNLFAIYIRYFRWTRDTFPSNNEKAMQLLEKCTIELKDDATLKNNEVFVKMWIEYAEMVRTPGEVFSYMQSNKIGEKVALFWVAWAFIAEKAENYKLTEQIFQKGIKKQAEPRKLLQDRYKQFQRRMARRFINEQEALGERQESVSAPEGRKALKTISQTQHTSSRGQITGSASYATDENITHRGGSRGRGLSTTASSTSGRTSVSSRSGGNSAIEIFQDTTSSGDTPCGHLTENPDWKILGSNSQRTKENNGLISKWTDAPLAPTSSTSSSSQSLPLVTVPAIPVFVDEEQDQPFNHKKTENHNGEGKGLSIRKMLEGTKKGLAGTESERISRDPLSRHKLQDVKKGDQEELHQEDLKCVDTANSVCVAEKAESTSTLDVVGSTGVPLKSAASFSSSSASSFQIFTDNNESSQLPLPKNDRADVNKKSSSSSSLSSSSSSSSSIPPFQIFTDDGVEASQGPLYKNNRGEITKKSTSSLSSSSSLSSASCFQIFGDVADTSALPKSARAESNKKSTTSSSIPSFQIFTDVADTSKLPLYKNDRAEANKKSTASSALSFQIFTDDAESSQPPLPKNNRVEANKKSTTSSSTSSFKIFTDDAESSSPLPSRKIDRASAPSFQIFTDTPKEVNQNGLSSFQIFEDSPAVASTSQGFEIFTDDLQSDARNRNPYRETQVKSKPKLRAATPPRSISPPTSAGRMMGSPSSSATNLGSHAMSSRSNDDERELDAFMSELGILDGEDNTINTRLAKREIDSMFCSPTADTRNVSYNSYSTKSSGLPLAPTFSMVSKPFLTAHDLSAIKEVSFEQSIFGTLATPGADLRSSNVSRSSSNMSYISGSDTSGEYGEK